MGSVPWDDHGTTTLVQARHISASLPIILCAPHGGNAVDGDQAETLLERPSSSPTNDAAGGGENGTAARRGTAVSLIADVGTLQLVEEIDRRLTRQFSSGEGFTSAVDAPAVVVAKFHRKYVDANRPLEESGAVAVHPSCRRATEVHECYHGAIETAVRALGSRDWGKAGSLIRKDAPQEDVRRERRGSRLLLLDVHGQRKFEDKVLIGTCDGMTADLEALNATGKGFLWHLRRNFNSHDENPRAIAGRVDNRNGNRPRADSRAEVREEGRDREDNQVLVEKRASFGGKDDTDGGCGLDEAVDENSAVVLPLYGDKEKPGYTGGYTVRRHGVVCGAGVASVASTEATLWGQSEEGGHPITVDAVQLEFGSLLRRTSDARAVAAEAVATAIFDYLKHQAESLQGVEGWKKRLRLPRRRSSNGTT